MKLSVRSEPRFAFEFSGLESTSFLKVLHIAQQVLEANQLEDAHERAALAFCKTVIPALKKRGILDTHPEIEETYSTKAAPVEAPKAPVAARPAPKPVAKPALSEDSIDSLIDSVASGNG